MSQISRLSRFRQKSAVRVSSELLINDWRGAGAWLIVLLVVILVFAMSRIGVERKQPEKPKHLQIVQP